MNELEKEILSKYRSETIEKFINMETFINATISQHYLKKLLQSFFLEVLYDKYFAFGLKCRILFKESESKNCLALERNSLSLMP